MRALTACQRWRQHRHSWRRTSEGGFDRSRYDVADLAVTDACRFVLDHHYSGSVGSVNRAAGLYDGAALVGVAAWGSPSSPFTLANTFPDLEPERESTELLRFVLLDEVPANAESWFLAAAHAQLARAGFGGVVAFSDPTPRRRANGTLITPGHVGTIYQASNAVLTGRSKARQLSLLPDGRVLSERALSKVTSGQRGGPGVVRRLVAMGARPPGETQDLANWLRGALGEVGVRPLNHPGNYRYAFAIGPRRRHVRVGGGRLAYPKRDFTVAEQMELT